MTSGVCSSDGKQRNTTCIPTALCREAVLSATHSPDVLKEKLVFQTL